MFLLWSLSDTRERHSREFSVLSWWKRERVIYTLFWHIDTFLNVLGIPIEIGKLNNKTKQQTKRIERILYLWLMTFKTVTATFKWRRPRNPKILCGFTLHTLRQDENTDMNMFDFVSNVLVLSKLEIVCSASYLFVGPLRQFSCALSRILLRSTINDRKKNTLDHFEAWRLRWYLSHPFHFLSSNQSTSVYELLELTN